MDANGLVDLAGFASIYEVAFGLNAVLSIWTEAHNHAVKTFDAASEEHIKQKFIIEKEIESENKTVARLYLNATESLNSLVKITQYGRNLSLFLAVVCFWLLLIPAIHADIKLHWAIPTTFAFCVVLGSPVLMWFSKLMGDHKLKKFKLKCKEALEDCETGEKATKNKLNKHKKTVSSDVEEDLMMLLSDSALEYFKTSYNKKGR
ncbi:MAG: hypothetical protein VX100_07350 [Pseudomonadota bacterium]|nr:hypothetical protein [Pseudomonadota bacterium]